MKKLRMIVTSVIVLAIVGSAFSLNVKKRAFCIVAFGTSSDCTTYITLKKTISDLSTSYKYFPCIDFDPVACTATGNGLCTDGPIRFQAD
jgi:hypothetical protein